MLAVRRRLGLIPDPDAPPVLVAAAAGTEAAAGETAQDAKSSVGEGEGVGGDEGSGASGSGASGSGVAHELTDAQAEELLAAVEAMRRRPSNTDEYLHGWRLIYSLRAAGSSSRGDMTAIDPRDGQKIYSLVGLR